MPDDPNSAIDASPADVPRDSHPQPKREVDDHLLRDREFMKELDSAKDVRSFLIKQGVFKCDIQLGALSSLTYSSDGRYPTDSEWNTLTTQSALMYSFLVGDLRLKYLATRAPRGIVLTACASAAVAIIGTAVATFFDLRPQEPAFLVLWCISLGILGSIAYVSMNMLSLQSDITFDFRDTRLTYLRIVLGGLFGLVIGFPFGVRQYDTFIQSLHLKSQQFDQIDSFAVGGYLLLPFILGFSTALVVAVLGRFIQAVQTLLGNQEGKPLPKTP